MGKGMAIFLNEDFILEEKDDIWWAGDWDNTAVVHWT